MLRKETVQEIFVESQLKSPDGRYLPLPLVGQLFVMGAKREWLTKKFPNNQRPLVSFGPKILPDGTEGFTIRKEIVFKR